ncbi:MAG TPA: hypothetical protein VK278_04290 [Gaiellaceae bacterium]|nr:hypothetical protein [Gaiellaceae bacterium]
MKTAIPIPDVLFQRADELAQRLGKSRSQVYQDAQILTERAEHLSESDLALVLTGIDLVLGRA